MAARPIKHASAVVLPGGAHEAYAIRIARVVLTKTAASTNGAHFVWPIAFCAGRAGCVTRRAHLLSDFSIRAESATFMVCGEVIGLIVVLSGNAICARSRSNRGRNFSFGADLTIV
jgi:hypothetical protein